MITHHSWTTQQRNENAMDISQLSEDAMICYCKKVTKQTIKKAIERGATTLKEVASITGACQSSEFCQEMNPNQRCCAIDIIAILHYYKEKK